MCKMNIDEIETFPDFYNFVEIGFGSTSKVYEATHKILDMKIAIKFISREFLTEPKSLENLRREIDVLEYIDHPFIASYWGTVETKLGFNIISEHVPKGNLLNFIIKNQGITEDQVRRFLCEACSAIHYLHTSLNVVHRDIKLENMMLTSSGDLKLIDFGMSTLIESKNFHLQTNCGTVAYAAPELFQRQLYGKGVDIWALGVSLFAMSTSRLPFTDNNMRNLIVKIIKSEPEYPDGMNSNLKDLIQKMLIKDQDKRITIEEIAKHPYVTNSSYWFLLDPKFYSNNKFMFHPQSFIDIDIVSEMCLFNQQALLNPFTPEGLQYRQIRSKKILALVHEEFRKQRSQTLKEQKVTSGSQAQIIPFQTRANSTQLRIGKRLSGIKIIKPNVNASMSTPGRYTYY